MTVERDGAMHLEVFVPGVRLPCWCVIGSSHMHQDWVAAGGPDTTGRPDSLDDHRDTATV